MSSIFHYIVLHLNMIKPSEVFLCDFEWPDKLIVSLNIILKIADIYSIWAHWDKLLSIFEQVCS